MLPRLRSLAKLLWPQLLVAVGYFVTAQVSLRVLVINGQVSPVWLPAGVGFWAVGTFGLRVLPGVVVGTFAATMTTDAPVAFCALNGLGNAVEAAIAWAFWRRAFQFRAALDRLQDVAALAVAAAAAPAVAAAVGAATLIGLGMVPTERLFEVAWVWWLGDAMGALLVAPLLLTWRWGSQQRPTASRVAEAILLAGLLVASAAVVFAGTASATPMHAHAFLLFPPAVWAALRFGPQGGAPVAFLIAMLAAGATRLGMGPFVYQVVVHGVVVLQLFLAVLAITTQLLAAGFAERRRATARSVLLAHAVQHTHEGVLIVGATAAGEPVVEYANEGFARLSGRRVRQVTGHAPWATGDAQPEQAAVEALRAALRRRAPAISEWVLRRPDGSSVHTELQLSPIPGERSVLVFRDLGERKRLEAQLVLSERMASVGMVAAGLAHEINNPLSYVSLNLQMLERELALPSGAEDRGRQQALLHDTLYGTQRVRDIVRSLRMLSRDAAGERGPVDLNQVIELTLALSRHELDQRGTLVKELGSVPWVLANEARLGQVLLNLLVNAIHALPAAGDPTAHRVVVRTRADPTGRAVVEVSDTGVGIPREVLPRIFEPFFTTKPAGLGTGLGLFICRQLVEEHQGELEVESAVGQGSTFRILLPPAPGLAAGAGEGDGVVADPAAVPMTKPTAAAAAKARTRVLIVDDEVRLAQSMRLLLRDEHEVELCHDGAQALERVARGERFDVILCDLQMPGITGMELWRRLHAEHPQLADRLLFVSGGACSQDARDFVDRMGERVLEKPVQPELLLSSVRGVLARAAAAAAAA